MRVKLLIEKIFIFINALDYLLLFFCLTAYAPKVRATDNNVSSYASWSAYRFTAGGLEFMSIVYAFYGKYIHEAYETARYYMNPILLLKYLNIGM